MKEKEVFIYCNVTKLNLFLSFHHKMHNIRLLDKKGEFATLLNQTIYIILMKL